MFSNNTHFGFIGFGLIGGTVARALRILYPNSEITGFNYRKSGTHPKLSMAVEEGTLSSVSVSLEEMAECDVLFLCAPVLVNIGYLKQLKPLLGSHTMITDVGSVKRDIAEAVEDLDLGSHFVGGHPMTGLEKTGYENSRADLLKNCFYVISPVKNTPPEFTEALKDFAERSGARTVIMDPAVHDHVVAGISHGPHVISASLVNSVHDLDRVTKTPGYSSSYGAYHLLAAGGFKDITRISSSSPVMWHDICISNKDAILEFLDHFSKRLDEAKEAIRNEDDEAVTEIFSEAKKYRDTFTNHN